MRAEVDSIRWHAGHYCEVVACAREELDCRPPHYYGASHHHLPFCSLFFCAVWCVGGGKVKEIGTICTSTILLSSSSTLSSHTELLLSQMITRPVPTLGGWMVWSSSPSSPTFFYFFLFRGDVKSMDVGGGSQSMNRVKCTISTLSTLMHIAGIGNATMVQ